MSARRSGPWSGLDDDYISSTGYNKLGTVSKLVLGTGTKRVRLSSDFDTASGRVSTNAVETNTTTGADTGWTGILSQAYGYDDVGNVRSIKEPVAGAVTSQCFKYDGLRQLAQAWTTAAATCQSDAAQSGDDGADPYWIDYTYTTSGSRRSDVSHTATGTVTRTYNYTKADQPHTLSSVDITDASTGTDSYAPDRTGNVTTRNLSGKRGQTLTWDDAYRG
jgi:hypothetical protein